METAGCKVLSECKAIQSVPLRVIDYPPEKGIFQGLV